MNAEDVKQVWDSNKRELLRTIDAFVVDEVSMVIANLIDAMDAFLRLNGRDRKKPFGGAQVVLFGDPTLERIVVDLGRGAFEHGQVYVALSRCPTLEGITLATEIWPYDVLKVSSRVREFMGAVAKSALLPGSEGWLLAGGVRK